MSKNGSARIKKFLKKNTIIKGIGKVILFLLIGLSAVILGTSLYLLFLDKNYTNKVYPRVFVGVQNVAGKSPESIRNEWETNNNKYKNTLFELRLDSTIATISGQELELGYDGKLIARQAYLIGRSGNIFSDIYTKLMKDKTVITPYFRWNQELINTTLNTFAEQIDKPAQDARFSFKNGKVNEFLPEAPGKRLNKKLAIEQFKDVMKDVPYSNKKIFTIILSVENVLPNITTGDSNQFGIKEKLASGYSEFSGSIPSRIHNVSHAASKFDGVLIAPGEIFSFNKIIGEISQTTGYKTAYIIKEGRTVLGDGGGVCQVSTTLFRAALNAGLPILDWSPHAYRVQYYEQAGYKPGIDATIFEPSVDLKFKNDTPQHILIQTITDKKNLSLTINIYGTNDGRQSQILNHQILSQSPAPPPLYQDDPTLPIGTIKQVDWAAAGAKTVFTHKVTRGSEILINRQFVSNFRPWQAIFLKGTQQ